MCPKYFKSKRFYSAPIGTKAAGSSFKDMWTWADVDEAYLEKVINDYPYLVQFIQSVEVIHGKPMMAYLTYMTQRILEMHRVLKDTGSLYLHCDPTASHYLKIILDRVFGKNNFRNEIVWCYPPGGKAPKYAFHRKHDLIFYYSKSSNPKFRHSYRPLTDYQKSKFTKTDKNGRKYKEYRGKTRTYLDNLPGSPVPDWWYDVPSLGQTISKEKVGYPTQKPLALLDRIIKASSNEGDLVLDPFCGCATTCVAAQQLNRKWIGIDIESKSADLVVDRLSDDAGLFSDFIHRTDTPRRTDVKIESPDSGNIKERLHKAQEGLCNGCETKMESQTLRSRPHYP